MEFEDFQPRSQALSSPRPRPQREGGEKAGKPFGINIDCMQALFFSLSNWETGASKMPDRTQDWSE